MINDYHRETAFLKECLRYDDTAERHRLEASITGLEAKESCVRRALRRVAMAGALALVGLAYTALFTPDFPLYLTGFMERFVTKMFCAVEVGSLVCLVVFTGLLAVYRRELNQRREECRRVAKRILESRLGRSESFKGTPPETARGTGYEQQTTT